MAPWVLPLKRAMNHGGTQRAKRDRREAKRKQLQLATVDPSSGRPSVRTVVFRGFLPAKHIGGGNGESCVLTFITDSRANKVRHLATGPGLVELCWWLDEAGVQYRISGRAVLASATSTDPELRTICEAIWERLGSGTRSTFTWPQPGAPRARSVDGGSPKSKADSTVDMMPEEEAAGEQVSVSLDDANFAVILVFPEVVDELHLGGKQKRYMYTATGALPGGCIEGTELLSWIGHAAWNVEDVNP